MNINRSIMAFGAHADDIELQAGGTLSKYIARGYSAIYVMTTNNMSGDWASLQPDGTVTSRRPPWHEIMPMRKIEAAAGAKFFKTEPIHLDYPQKHYVDERGDRVVVGYGSPRPECVPPGVPTILTAQENTAAVARVTDLILEHKPEAILTHGGPMENVEHFTTLVLVTKAYRAAVEKGYTGLLLNWHDLGVELYGKAYQHFDTHIDITEFWDHKIKSCLLHATQKPAAYRLDWPKWGPLCGCGHAEVYVIVDEGKPSEPAGEFTREIMSNRR
jgi:LmbE family N-acetylglucosaminyl deacetylase